MEMQCVFGEVQTKVFNPSNCGVLCNGDTVYFVRYRLKF